MVSSNKSTSLSLLERLRDPANDEAWRQFDDCYRPMLRRWLRGQGVNATDADDLEQEIMQVAIAELPSFKHNGWPGALRSWLRMVTANRLRTFRRRTNRQEKARGGSDYGAIAEQLADPESQVSRVWDEEYRHAVLRQLLEMASGGFEQQTVKAFRRVVIDGQKPTDVVRELGISANALRIAKSRILAKMRELGAGMLD